MGLMLKYRPAQQAQWHIFNEHMYDVFERGKLIGLPLGKAGYGFAANPASPRVIDMFWKIYGENFLQELIFITDSAESAQMWGKFFTPTQKVADHFWPGDLVIHLPFHRQEGHPIQETLFDQNPELETALLNTSIYILVPQHPVVRSVLESIKAHGHPPLLIGFYAALDAGYNAPDGTTLANSFGGDEVGVILDAGKVQKSKKYRPATQIAIFEEDFVQIEREGLISEAALAEILPQLDQDEL